MNTIAVGVILCVLSQVLFSSLFLLSYHLQPLSGTVIFAFRIVMMALSLWGIFSIYTAKQKHQQIWQRLSEFSFSKWLILLLGSAILGSQLWLFMWAPINNEGLNVAMGYFLFPLVMVFAGKMIWHEKLTPLQLIALILVMIGVIYEYYRVQTFSWITLWVALLYPPYYLSRRILNVPVLTGLMLDLSLIMPVALIYLYQQFDQWYFILQQQHFWYLLPTLGLVSALAMLLNMRSSTLLPMKLFGLLSYIEPTLLFILSITLLNDQVQPTAYITYGFIWAALLALSLNGFMTRSHYSRIIKKRI